MLALVSALRVSRSLSEAMLAEVCTVVREILLNQNLLADAPAFRLGHQ